MGAKNSSRKSSSLEMPGLSDRERPQPRPSATRKVGAEDYVHSVIQRYIADLRTSSKPQTS